MSCINSDCEHHCVSPIKPVTPSLQQLSPQNIFKLHLKVDFWCHSKQHVVHSVVYDETANHAVTVRVKYRPFISVTTCGWQSEQFQFLELVQKYQQ